MKVREVMTYARQLATPSPSEENLIKLATELFLGRLNRALKKKFIKAKAICAGSFAKDTWLPGNTDVDCFVVFRYRTYKDKSDVLADILEPAIEECFTYYKRLHGSRDYFRTNYENYVFEIIPVLKVKKPSKALNITDVSPMHVGWVKKKTKKTRLANQIRMAKLFFKASGVYGAESYIHGFSGHVIEILVSKYGSFVKLARATQNWTPKVYIDPERHYYTKKRAMRKLNKSKLHSPLILVDPIQPERNAAAALDIKKFKGLISTCKRFLAKPRIDFFKEKEITVEDLKAKVKKGSKLIILKAAVQDDKKDIAGAKLLKQFEKLTKRLEEHDFKIMKKGWSWEGLESDALFWFYFDKKILPSTRKHLGPPLSAEKERAEGFIEKYGKLARRDAKQLYVILKRKYRKPEPLLNSLLRDEEFKNIEVAE